MFLDFYQLREQPFGVTPNPDFLYLGDQYREALASLVYAVRAGRGFHALIAPPGLGKTTLLFRFVTHLKDANKCVFLFNTLCDRREFLRSVISDLDIGAPGHDLAEMQSQLNDFLVQTAREGKNFVLVVDEAQNLSDDVLELVRLLSNFETPRRKLMHIVLSGQPQLEAKLAQPHLTQLRQRISLISRLKPLEPADVHNYVRWRLHVAGVPDIKVFEPDALDLIALQSEGVPRNINNLCFHSLSLGYAKGKSTITRDVVEEAIADNQLVLGGPIAASGSQLKSEEKPKPPFVPPAPPPVEFSAKPPVAESQVAPESPLRPYPNLGPIAKVSLQERRRPSYRAAVYACATIVVGSLLIFHNLPQRIANASQPQLVPPSIAAPAVPAVPQGDASVTTSQPEAKPPDPVPSVSNISSMPAQAVEAPATIPPRVVIVQPYDTLWGISQRELPDIAPPDGIQQILGMNTGINPHHLHAGQKILLPSPREEQTSDTATVDRSTQSSSSRSKQR